MKPEPKLKKAAYAVRKGMWPYWTKGLAEYYGPNLWLFSPYKDDHKVVLETSSLFFY
jgi:hypothetical protein